MSVTVGRGKAAVSSSVGVSSKLFDADQHP